MTIDGLVPKLVSALDDEIRAQRRGQRAYPLYAGRECGRGEGILYQFNTGVELTLAEGSSCTVQVRDRRYRCVILGIEQGSVLVSSTHAIEGSLLGATLFSAAWFLLEDLRTRVLEIANPRLDFNRSFVLKVFGFDPPAPDAEEIPLRAAARDCILKFEESQRNVIAAASRKEVGFIWGPPATAKTTANGGVVRAAVDRDETVLVVAPTNVAVDQATLSIAQALEGTSCLADGDCVRIGTPRLEEVRALDAVNPHAILRRRQPALVEELDRLEDQQREIRDRLRDAVRPNEERADLQLRLDSLTHRLEPLRAEYLHLEAELIQNAKVVIATLSKMCTSQQIHGRRFDVLVVDEAGMATSPAIAVAVGLARKRAMLTGDFRQLAPVAVARTKLAKEWLAQDIFHIAGIVSSVESVQHDSRLLALYLQHRMHPAIRALVSDLFYDGILRDGASVEAETAPIAALAPVPGQPIVFCDVGPVGGLCYRQNGRGSHFNIASALVCVDMARQALAGGARDVSILAPYSAQARILSLLVREARLDRPVRVATVHALQGGRADVIVFDFVDTGPLTQPGMPLRQGAGGSGARLLNVAFSRARGKLVMVGDLRFLRATTRQDSILHAALARIPESAITTFTPALADHPLPPGQTGVQWFNEETVLGALAEDLRSLPGNIMVNTSSRRILGLFTREMILRINNQRSAIGFAAREELAPQHLRDGFAFHEPLTEDQIIAIGANVLWYGRAAAPHQGVGLFARIALPEVPIVLAEMTGVASMLPLAAPPIDAVVDAVFGGAIAEAPPDEPVSQPPQSRQIVFGRRRLGI